MKICIISKFGHMELMESSFIPRKGDNVCMFYNPPPVVSKVLLWPDKTIKEKIELVEDVDAIIMVE